MLEFFTKFFRSDPLERLRPIVALVAEREAAVEKLSDDELKTASEALKIRTRAGESLDDILPEAFALAREAARRTLRQRPFDVQVLGGIVIHEGAVAEMMTGEGKTLTGVAPTYLNALPGLGVHVVTVNEYLARRDAVWMGQIHRALGLTVACLVPNGAYLYDPEWRAVKEGETALDAARDVTGNFLVQQDFLRPISRREAYAADITYGTNHEFGFDYLRDNLAYSTEAQVQRGHAFAIIDEVDSILIDEARTPLIIAAPDAESSDFYKTFARVASRLTPEADYTVDEKLKSVSVTESGIEKAEAMVGVQNLYSPENIRLVHYFEESLKAQALFRRDKDYVVKDGEVFIVDEFTGRILHGRRYNGGLHQAIEAKEGVLVKEESRTYAKISIQNYFRMYRKISGMTGTAQTSAEEFHKVYGLEVISVPTHRPMIREDRDDLVYKNAAAKWRAVIEDVKERRAKGQPVLIGTTSIEKNEHISALLQKVGVPHEVLNAKNNEREGAIIAQAGAPGAVTVATNVAGRGVDIILGGNPPILEEAAAVREAGGLHVIGTERHEARRIDNQLRGRSGRQGDPGSSQFYLSLDDDLMRVFGGERIKGMMDRFDIPEDEPIQMGFVSKAVAQAQSKVEGSTFDMRKHLLEYDDVLNKQRASVYRRRQAILGMSDPSEVAKTVAEAALAYLEHAGFGDDPGRPEELDLDPAEVRKMFEEANIANKDHAPSGELTPASARELIGRRAEDAAKDGATPGKLLSVLDMLWMTHLENLEALADGVGLRAYGQKDPLVEYRQEAHRLFKDFWANWEAWIFMNLWKSLLSSEALAKEGASQIQVKPAVVLPKTGVVAGDKEPGRNDPCFCGSGKKYKKCHGK